MSLLDDHDNTGEVNHGVASVFPRGVLWMKAALKFE